MILSRDFLPEDFHCRLELLVFLNSQCSIVKGLIVSIVQIHFHIRRNTHIRKALSAGREVFSH